MLRQVVDYYLFLVDILFVTFPDQSVFVSVETFRVHSLLMMSQERNLSDPFFISTL